jgi:hypothetical protein
MPSRNCSIVGDFTDMTDTIPTANKLASDLRLIAARHLTILSQEEITSLELAAQRLGPGWSSLLAPGMGEGVRLDLPDLW